MALSGLCILFITGCKDKICPAFQSYYVLDDRQRDLMFSPFGEDTLPKMDYDVKKSTFGIVSQSPVLPYLQKLEDFKMVDRELLFAREAALDSVGSTEGELDVREELLDISDTTALGDQPDAQGTPAEDYRIPEKRNVEQATYDRLFGEYLKAAEEARKPKDKEKADTESAGKQGQNDSAGVEAPPDQGVDQQTEAEPDQPRAKKKKGLFGGFGKKKKDQESPEDTDQP